MDEGQRKCLSVCRAFILWVKEHLARFHNHQRWDNIQNDDVGGREGNGRTENKVVEKRRSGGEVR